MANEVNYRHNATGKTLYFTIRQPTTNNYWDTYASTLNFQTLTVANWYSASSDNYAISMSESPSGSYWYSGTFPAVSGYMVAGFYYVDVFQQAGSNPAISDTLVATLYGHWNGTVFDMASSNLKGILATLLSESASGNLANSFTKNYNIGVGLGPLIVTGTAGPQLPAKTNTFRVPSGLFTSAPSANVLAGMTAVIYFGNGASEARTIVSSTTAQPPVVTLDSACVTGTIAGNTVAIYATNSQANVVNGTTGIAPTAAQVATAVWTDTTGSDFTTANSPGSAFANVGGTGSVTIAASGNWLTSIGNVTVGGYATGQDPATLVWSATTGAAVAGLVTTVGTAGAGLTALAQASSWTSALATSLAGLVTTVGTAGAGLTALAQSSAWSSALATAIGTTNTSVAGIIAGTSAVVATAASVEAGLTAQGYTSALATDLGTTNTSVANIASGATVVKANDASGNALATATGLSSAVSTIDANFALITTGGLSALQTAIQAMMPSSFSTWSIYGGGTVIGEGVSLASGQLSGIALTTDVTSAQSSLETYGNAHWSTATSTSANNLPADYLSSTQQTQLATAAGITGFPSAAPSNWIGAGSIQASALNGKGDWLTEATYEASYVAPNNADITSILTMLGNVASAILDASDGVESGVTVRQCLRAMSAVLTGLINNAGTGTESFLGMDKATPRVSFAVDALGNRTAATYTLS